MTITERGGSILPHNGEKQRAQAGTISTQPGTLLIDLIKMKRRKPRNHKIRFTKWNP